MFQARSLGSVSPLVPVILTWLVVAGIAWSVSRSVLFFLADSGGVPSTADTAVRAENPAPTVDIQAVVSRHIFGEMNASPAAATTVTTVETRLPLELQAVFVATETNTDSRAIVAEKGSQGRLYRSGNPLPGGATLEEVHGDHIVLARGGTRERLNFPKLTGTLASPADGMPEQLYYDTPADYPPPDVVNDSFVPYEEAVQPEPIPVVPDPAPAETIQDYQARLEADPAGTLDELGVSAVSNEGAAGYRVGDLAQSPYLRQTGLQPGDVIVSVNGKPVGSVESDRMEIAGVLAQGSARVEIQRGSRRFFVNTSLDQPSLDQGR